LYERCDLSEELTDLLVLISALYFRSRAAQARGACGPCEFGPLLHQAALLLTELSEPKEEADRWPVQLARGVRDVVEGLADAAEAAGRAGEPVLAERLRHQALMLRAAGGRA
jgi:hypothetical protein